MKTTAYATLAAALMLSASAFQAQACTTSTTVNQADMGNLVGTLLGGPDTVLPGTADCSTALNAIGNETSAGLARLSRELEDAQLDNAALAAALSAPAWLEPGETFSISGGVGFSDGSAAVGATGLMRFDKNWSGFAGGAFSTENSDLWAAKAGVRVGF
jgi:ABC-type transport system substrate-binding protein